MDRPDIRGVAGLVRTKYNNAPALPLFHVSATSTPWMVSCLLSRSSVAVSSNGSRVVAVVNGGYIWTSQDYGYTW